MVRLVPCRCVSRRLVLWLTRLNFKEWLRKAEYSTLNERCSERGVNDRGGAALNEIQYGGRQRRKEKRKMIHSFCTHKSTETPKPWWHNFWRNQKKSNLIKGRPRTHHLTSLNPQTTKWLSCRLKVLDRVYLVAAPFVSPCFLDHQHIYF